MRKTKNKELKRIVIATLAVLFFAAGASFAVDQTWSEFAGQATSTPENMQLNNNVTTNSSLNLASPPVPGGTVFIQGNGHTITNGAPAGSSIIDNTAAPGGSDVAATSITIENTSFENGVGSSSEGFTNGGGALKNSAGTLTVRSTASNPADRSHFSNNTAGNGGAILNTGTGVLDVNNMNFEGNTATAASGTNVAYGGAIFNGSTAAGTVMTIANSSFTNNAATMSGGAYGGAIHHDMGIASITNSDFAGNNATSDGGAISNRAILTIDGNSSFDGNYARQGGALVNGYASAHNPIDAIVTISDTTFSNNYSGSVGGAIYNKISDKANDTVHKVIINQGSKFSNNYVGTAGANSPSGSGGAIKNEGVKHFSEKDAILVINGGDADSQKVVFENNIAGTGSAISNLGQATVNNAIFKSNGVGNTNLADGAMGVEGGAIHNSKYSFAYDSDNDPATTTIAFSSSAGEIEIRNSSFVDNTVSGYGGAIHNSSKATIIDSDFTGNKAGTSHSGGGAVYTTAVNSQSGSSLNGVSYINPGSDSETIIRAEQKDVHIGNANSLANNTDSIVMHGVTDSNLTDTYYKANTTLQAANGRTLNVHSKIIGGGKDASHRLLSNLNIGDSSKTYNGVVNVVGDATVSSSNVNIYSGTLSFDHDSSLDATNVLNMYGGTLDLLNGEYGVNQLQAKEFNLLADSNIMLDVDLAGEKMDGIYNDNFRGLDGNTPGSVTNPGGNKLTITDMYSWTDTNKDNVSIKFTDADALIGDKVVVDRNLKYVQSPTTKYAVTKTEVAVGEPEQGVYFGFSKLGPSDPGLSGPVAKLAAFLLMDNIYRQSFANMDMVTLMTPEQRMAWKMRNRYANAGYHRGVYAPNVLPEERDGLYLRPFSNFESVSLKGGPKVSNVFYGSLIGGESDIIDLGHGWDGNFSFFGAYHGSHQAYNGVDIWQNGGSVGGVATAYKGNFFTGLTANIGASAAEARHGFGNDQFPILMTGAAWKSGYNFGMANNKFILQPSYMMSYTFVNVFDYNSASGARISQDPLNAMEIIPGLKLIGNFKNGWQPYAACNMTWNIMDNTKFYANEVALPQLSVKPYFEYGVGMQKRTGDRFTGYGQAMLRSGGRNGIALTLGLRWALGH